MFRKLVIAAAMCSSLLTGAARAQEDGNTQALVSPSGVDTDYEVDKRRDQGWNAPWALVFQFNNILVNGNFLDSFRGLGVAGALMLNEDFMIRGGATLSRTSSPPRTTETTIENGADVTKTYAYTSGATSSGSVTVRADAVYRLTRNKVAPYVGAGPYVSYSHSRQTSDDDVSVPDVVTSVRNRSNSLTFGLRGLVGAEWRIHPSFALFAEYAASLDVITYSDFDNRTVVRSTVTGVETASSTRTEQNTPSWLNLSTGIAQGASLGLMVLF